MQPGQSHVRADCEELLGRFQKTDSVRFEVFSSIWRDMKFSQVFYGAVNHRKRLFSRQILDEASRYFLPPFSFQVRVGGLYLLYSLYHTQTASPPEQVRVALKDWEQVKKFKQDAVEAKHLDTVYILEQLLDHKAFTFTAMNTLLSYGKKRKMERSLLCEDFMERASRPQELINVDLLEEVSNIHDLYEKMKSSVSWPPDQPGSSGSSGSSVSVIHRDLVPQLRSSVLDFYRWQQKKDGAEEEEEEEEDSGEGTSSQQECSRRADRLAAIKTKAFGKATEASKGRRHRQVELNVGGQEVRASAGGSGQCRSRRSRRRRSLKARTMENIHVSGDWTEASHTTQIKQLTSLDFGPAEKKHKTYPRFKWC